MKKIYIIYTGGTIGMVQSSNGLTIDNNINNINNILVNYKKIINYDLISTNPLIDSSNISISNWNQWLSIIQNNINNYDGILILHGTDTLSYTSVILTCCLENLNKPVIITGAQYSAYSKNSDADNNIKASLYLFYTEYNKVGIVFNNKLLNPINCTKICTNKKDAFKNPYNKILAKFNADNNNWVFNISIHKLKDHMQQEELKFHFLSKKIKIANFFIIPNLMGNHLPSIIDHYDYDAIILQSFGNGNLPDNQQLIKSLAKFINNKNKIVLNISQVFQGDATFLYEANNKLYKIGIINCGKITIETAYAKLLYCISKNFKKNNLIQYILNNNKEYIF